MPELARAYTAENIWLFGSFAKGLNRDDSDIDLLIETQEKLSRESARLLKHSLSARAGIRIDIVFTTNPEKLFERLVIPEHERIHLYPF